jgi:glycogen operon protein
MGDEVRRTQQGNNNAYCQDNEISWFDWTLVNTHTHLVDFTRWMIEFRKRHPGLRRRQFFRGVPSQRGLLEIAWHGCNLNSPGFARPEFPCWRGFARDSEHGRLSSTFQLPAVVGRKSYRALDTIFPPARHVHCSGK